MTDQITAPLGEALDAFDEPAQGRVVRILRVHANKARTSGERVWLLALASFADERSEESSLALIAAAADLAPGARQFQTFVFENLGAVPPGDVLHDITAACLTLLLITELPIDVRGIDALRAGTATVLPVEFLDADGTVIANSIAIEH